MPRTQARTQAQSPLPERAQSSAARGDSTMVKITDDVLAAWDSVRDDADETKWMLCAYDDKKTIGLRIRAAREINFLACAARRVFGAKRARSGTPRRNLIGRARRRR